MRPLAISAGLAAIAVVVIVVATPLFVRQPHIAGDDMAAGDLRTLARAQHVYAAAASGAFGSLECLVALSPPCAAAPGTRPLLDQRFLQTERGGYRFELRLGPAGSRSFAYLALPVTRKAGATRSLCIDASGEVRHAAADQSLIRDGRCDAALPALR